MLDDAGNDSSADQLYLIAFDQPALTEPAELAVSLLVRLVSVEFLPPPRSPVGESVAA